MIASVCVAVAVCIVVGVAVSVGAAVSVGVAVSAGVAVSVGVGVSVGAAISVGAAVSVGVGLCVSVCVAILIVVADEGRSFVSEASPSATGTTAVSSCTGTFSGTFAGDGGNFAICTVGASKTCSFETTTELSPDDDRLSSRSVSTGPTSANTTNLPVESAVVSASLSPSIIKVTSAPGLAVPAIRALPSASTRTTSNAGTISAFSARSDEFVSTVTPPPVSASGWLVARTITSLAATSSVPEVALGAFTTGTLATDVSTDEVFA